MSDQFELRDETLGAAGRLLAQAAEHAVAGGTGAPQLEVRSLTQIDGRVQWFLEGVATARGALADAAISAGRAVAALMRESAELDAHLAAALPGEFAVSQPRAPRT
jgi:hypothetical protein